MGGIGKTVLAQALCADPKVQRSFPDGIAWVTIGRESPQTLLERLRAVGRALGEDFSKIEDESECVESYRAALGRKAALVVVDDVWESKQVEPFRVAAPHSRLLFTTRNAEIAAVGGGSNTQRATGHFGVSRQDLEGLGSAVGKAITYVVRTHWIGQWSGRLLKWEARRIGVRRQ